MTKARGSRKRSRAVKKCPQANCGSDHIVKNASYKTRRRGLVRRLICRRCGHRWEEQEKPSGLFNHVGFYDSDEAILQSFALVAEGLPLEQVGGLMGRKADTIQDRLLRCFGDQRLWATVTESLISTYSCSMARITEFSTLLDGMLYGAGNFHAAARRKAARETRSKRATLKWQRRQEKIFRQFFTNQWHRRGLTPEQIELEWNRLGLRNTFELAPGEMRKKRNDLKRRIERILSCKVVVTTTGVFYRLKDDARVLRWLRAVQQFDGAKEAKVLRLLSHDELDLLGQLNCLPGTTAALARIEQELRGRTHQANSEPKLNSAMLTDPRYAAGMIDALRSLAEALRPQRCSGPLK